MRFRYLKTVLSVFSVVACAQDASNLPKSQPPKTWFDVQTGHRIVRISDEPNSASLYFNGNAYTADGKGMVYSTPNGISVVDLSNFKTRSVVTGRVRIVNTGRKNQTVYYVKNDDHSLYVTNIETGATRRIGALPPRAGIDTINADETLAAGAYVIGGGTDYGNTAGQQTHPLDQPANKGQMMERTLAAHLPRVLYVVNLQTGEQKIILHSTDWLNHLLFSPTDPTLLMYCHEGPWQKVDRIWTIRTDGTQNTLIHKRTMEMEIAGHEFWGQDGKTIWYDWQTPKGEDFWIAGYDVNTHQRTAYHMQRDEWSIHFNVSKDGSLFCGDGGDPGQVAHAPDGEWLYLFHPTLIKNTGVQDPNFVRAGVFHAEKLANMSKHHYHLEPNVSFTPDQKWVIFRSNMFGPTYVFAVEVAKTTDSADHATAGR
ncbi:MAG TPA: oligogalacturonate lyase family protein [Bryobacteraceae bacterium]|nr:oligogalacturonate lyase family protein [Bryobacteraceae bacterium]